MEIIKMRTNIVIEEKLIKNAMRATGLKTKKAVVEEGLKVLLRLKQQEAVKAWRGKLPWEGNLDEMRIDKK
jgi:Arc/MetJ family transcription regulator